MYRYIFLLWHRSVLRQELFTLQRRSDAFLVMGTSSGEEPDYRVVSTDSRVEYSNGCTRLHIRALTSTLRLELRLQSLRSLAHLRRRMLPLAHLTLPPVAATDHARHVVPAAHDAQLG